MTTKILLLLAVCALAHATDIVVQTTHGPVQGYTSWFTGCQVFRGIPYAAPPVGDLRFKSPQPPTPWTTVRPASTQAQICIQLHVTKGIYIGGEDCLYLNVYAPPNTNASSNLPVMVWIYGGGFVFGDAWEFGFYDGQNLARNHNAIIVAMNYRLGPAGFLAADELRDESPDRTTGNYGVQDQQMALMWVRDNIANFGGNPHNVTIFGESAGAFSVCWHLVSPRSAGLFHAAIMESGTCDSPQFFVNYNMSTAFSYEFMTHSGCNRSTLTGEAWLACVRQLSADQVFSGWLTSVDKFVPMLWPSMPWGPTLDGSPAGLLDVPLKSIRAGKWARVPLLAGTNKNEGSVLLLMFLFIFPGIKFPLDEPTLHNSLFHFFPNKTIVDTVFELYPMDGTYSSQNNRAAAILRDYFFACAARRTVASVSDQAIPAYLYHFTYKGDWIDDWLLGDYHSSELEYVFDNQWPPLIHTFSQNDQAMADTFGYYWTNFAKYLNPNGLSSNSTQAQWPVYTRDADLNLVMEVPSSVQTHLYKGQCDYFDSVQTLIGQEWEKVFWSKH